MRLIDPAAERIYDTAAAEYLLSQLRAQVALVPQDLLLFAEPLKDNLTYDDPARALTQSGKLPRPLT